MTLTRLFPAALTSLLLGLSACVAPVQMAPAPTEAPVEYPPAPPPPPDSEALLKLRADGAKGGYGAHPVLFATDRDLDPAKGPDYPDRGEGLRFGQCLVTIPKDRTVGELKSPLSLLSFRQKENPAEHVMLQGVETFSRPEFTGASVARSGGKDVLLFVHGFNVGFADACKRTAQLTQDLKFQGAVLLFSWPSKAKVSAYLRDEEEVMLSASHLSNLLHALQQEARGARIHLVAHSMGARLLYNALQALPQDWRRRTPPVFQNVVLAAPDINRQLFEQTYPTIRGLGARYTLYASSNDNALKVAKGLRGYPRLGEAGADLLVLPGLDSIDASVTDTSVLGHSYYRQNAAIISDLYDIVVQDLPPDKRFALEARGTEERRWWTFRSTATK